MRDQCQLAVAQNQRTRHIADDARVERGNVAVPRQAMCIVLQHCPQVFELQLGQETCGLEAAQRRAGYLRQSGGVSLGADYDSIKVARRASVDAFAPNGAPSKRTSE